MLARMLDAGGAPRPAAAARAARRRPGGPGAAAPRGRARASPSPRPTASPRRARRSPLAEPGDLETAGRPLPGTGLTIAADGEILVSGPTVVGEWDALRTGDLGRLDDEGRLTVIGRKSDTIVTGGENVAPAEVEAVLEEHPGVAEAGVFAREHPLWGEAVGRADRAARRARADRRRAARALRRAARGLQGPEGVRARRRGSRARPLASCCAGS